MGGSEQAVLRPEGNRIDRDCVATVTKRPEEYVVDPAGLDGDEEGVWPAFIVCLRAKRNELVVEGNASAWPDRVVIRMRDIRSRLSNTEQWFDDWTVTAPDRKESVFCASTTLNASWLDEATGGDTQSWPPLPDLEAEVSWDGKRATVPVVFDEKHLFPVVETQAREDEQSLVAWFLGLRPVDEVEAKGFGHSIDPTPSADGPDTTASEILSYLVRDFVHALPGIRNRLTDAGVTETGLRGALLGPRSPVALAREAVRAYKEPQPGRPRKTMIATAFQIAELRACFGPCPFPSCQTASRVHCVTTPLPRFPLCSMNSSPGFRRWTGRMLSAPTWIWTDNPHGRPSRWT